MVDIHFATAENRQGKEELECGPKVMTAVPNIGVTLYKSSLIPLLVTRHKVWLTPTAQVSCSSATNVAERKARSQSILHLAKFRQWTRAPENV